jgi:hypothetical protein
MIRELPSAFCEIATLLVLCVDHLLPRQPDHGCRMTSQDIATQALLRWSELREQNIACRDRLQDLELQKLERDLEAIRREMAPIRACIDRR